MSRGQQSFRQNDLTKALKATIKAGIAVGRVEIDRNGKIVIVPAKPEDAADRRKPEANEWDEAFDGSPTAKVR
jgi:hypothetical protein